jgi:plasmid stability protein
MGLIQVRDVPEDVHRTLKSRAAAEGISLSDYVLREVVRVARTPTPEELDERIRSRGAAGVSTADILAARDAGREA